MTTLDDTISAVLASPIDGAGHCALLDRLTEETDDARAAALALVLKNPENDGPRLVYAEWCERNGEKERGEFIRVQCELAGWETQPCECRMVGEINLCRCERCKPIHRSQVRERDLLRFYGSSEWFGVPELRYIRPDSYTDRMAGSLRWCGERNGLEVFDVWPVRGFIERVECRASAWLTYGDMLTAAHPVRNVRLTTLPEFRRPDERHRDVYQFVGRQGAWLVPQDEYIQNYLLAMEWPGVTFELRSAPATTAGLYDPAETTAPVR